MDLRTGAVFTAAAAVRLLLSALFPSLHSVLNYRVEVTTSMASFKQLREGLFLHQMGISPYDGGVYHQAPILLYIFAFIDKFGSTTPESLVINVLYLALDLMTAYYLCLISRSKMLADSGQLSSWIIASVYLLNPLVIVTNLARSTAVLSNMLTICAIAHACNGRVILSAAVLALASHINFYVCYLVPPLLIVWRSTSAKGTVASGLAVYVTAFAVLLSTGYYMTGSWQYMSSSYGFLLSFGDLVPNMGLWWYFFMEMFDFFRPLFTYIFQLYSLIFVLPLTLRIPKQPLFAITTIVGITTISKPYPEVGDLGVYISLLSLFHHIFANIRYTLLSALVVLHALVLAPSFYHLWIYLGSGNANFFYAVTLVYTVGVTILVTDSLRAVLRIEFDGGKDPSKRVVLI